MYFLPPSAKGPRSNTTEVTMRISLLIEGIKILGEILGIRIGPGKCELSRGYADARKKVLPKRRWRYLKKTQNPTRRSSHSQIWEILSYKIIKIVRFIT